MESIGWLGGQEIDSKVESISKSERNTMGGMLDISIINVDRALDTDEKIENFLSKRVRIQEKLDGTKLTILRTKNDYDPDDLLNNFIFSYKRQVLYPEDHAAVERDEAKNASIGDAQYAFVFDHFEKLGDLSSVPKNTEFFVEFLMAKPTLTRDYEHKHAMVLLGYASVEYRYESGLLTTYPEKIETVENGQYAELFEMDIPQVIFKGTPYPLSSLKRGANKALRSVLADNIPTFKTSDETKYFKAFKEALLRVPSVYGGKTEGVVMENENGLYKVLQLDQHDKTTRLRKKEKFQMTPELENTYFLEIKAIAKEYVDTLDFTEPMRTLLSKSSKFAYSFNEFPSHAKKNVMQKREDLFHNVKYLLVKRLEGNNNALFVGRFQPFTKLHAEIVRDALKEYDNVVIAIVKGRKSSEKNNPFTLEMQKEVIRSVFPDIEIMEVPTGSILPIMGKSPVNINAVLCGTDRVEGYTRQLRNNPEITVKETSRDPDGVSGTRVRNALISGDKGEFTRNMDPLSVKFYDKLRNDIMRNNEGFVSLISYDDFV